MIRGKASPAPIAILVALVCLIAACGCGGDGAAVDTCEGVSCSGHGACVVREGVVGCDCDEGYHEEGAACIENDPCYGVDCSGHGVCEVRVIFQTPYCVCDPGYHTQEAACVSDADPCGGVDCSGHGTCLVYDTTAVCACDEGYTPGNLGGLDCVPVGEVCAGGPIDYDVDDDGVVDTWFEPTASECLMYELVNRTRATHDDEGSPECHGPLMYSVEWSAHGRNHSKKMYEAGELYHDDVPMGQNCAYGCDPACEMDLYMNSAGEDHCPAESHHCNIMRCSFKHVGIGYWAGTWNTQNFY